MSLPNQDQPTLFSYTVRSDSGLAPNPFGGMCTLVVCKPVIRKVAWVGDWIVGLGSKNSSCGDRSECVVYVMEVTEIRSMEEYDTLCQEKLEIKIPLMPMNKNTKNEYVRWHGDCLWDFSCSPAKPKLNKVNQGHHYTDDQREIDIGGINALLSERFWYFGEHRMELPKKLIKLKVSRGHRSKSNSPYYRIFLDWIHSLEGEHPGGGVIGNPTEWEGRVSTFGC